MCKNKGRPEAEQPNPEAQAERGPGPPEAGLPACRPPFPKGTCVSCNRCDEDPFFKRCERMRSLIQDYCKKRGRVEMLRILEHLGSCQDFCHMYFMSLCNSALGKCHMPKGFDDVMDLSQELLRRVLEKPEHFWNPSKAPLGAWISVVATRLAISIARKKKPIPEADLNLSEGNDILGEFAAVLDGATPEDLLHQRELREIVRKRLAALDESSRWIIELRFFEGLKLKAIASLLGISISMTHKLIQRAIDDLRDGFGDDLGDLFPGPAR